MEQMLKYRKKRSTASTPPAHLVYFRIIRKIRHTNAAYEYFLQKGNETAALNFGRVGTKSHQPITPIGVIHSVQATVHTIRCQ